MNALHDAVVLDHPRDVQILDRDHTQLSHDVRAQFVANPLPVGPLVVNTPHHGFVIATFSCTLFTKPDGHAGLALGTVRQGSTCRCDDPPLLTWRGGVRISASIEELLNITDDPFRIEFTTVVVCANMPALVDEHEATAMHDLIRFIFMHSMGNCGSWR